MIEIKSIALAKASIVEYWKYSFSFSQNLFLRRIFLPSKSYKIALTGFLIKLIMKQIDECHTHFSRCFWLVSMNFFKQPLQSLFQQLVLAAMVEFGNKMPSSF